MGDDMRTTRTLELALILSIAALSVAQTVDGFTGTEHSVVEPMPEFADVAAVELYTDASNSQPNEHLHNPSSGGGLAVPENLVVKGLLSFRRAKKVVKKIKKKVKKLKKAGKKSKKAKKAETNKDKPTKD